MKTPTLTKYAVPRGSPAYLTCRAASVPQADFAWQMESGLTNTRKDVNPTDPNRGESVLPTQRAPSPAPAHVYDSVLKLDNVRSEHYSTVFTCIANNSFGSDHTDILLVAPGRPDPPSEVDVVSTSHDRVALTWIPGFDGGYNQTFVVSVVEQKTGREVKAETLDAKAAGWWINSTEVVGLMPHTSYLIRVQALNKAGKSEITEEVFVKTRSTSIKIYCAYCVSFPYSLIPFQNLRTPLPRRKSFPVWS